ncbi:hypothetical protein O3P69_009604 [Scylla paramamosain]|uniref:CCHC-type domain-containing protein n=1 Tax=Scylla paramamosain TaxID=85552 RepID=A0AAW0SV89_SCYPA
MPLPRRSPRSTPRASTTVVPRSLQPLLQQARQTISDQQQAITTLQANMAALITRGNVAPAPRVPLSAAPEKCDLDMTPAAFRHPRHGCAYEAARQHTTGVGGWRESSRAAGTVRAEEDGDQTLDAAAATTSGKTQPSRTCWNCGTSHAPDRASCPAREAVCVACRKKGHFKRCCRSSKRPHGTASANAVSGSVTTAGANVSRQPTIEVKVALGKGAKHRTAAVADTGAQVCVAGAALLSSLNIQPTQLQGRAGLRDVADLPLRCLGSCRCDIYLGGHATQQEVYFVPSARSLFLSLSACKELGLVPAGFPHHSLPTIRAVEATAEPAQPPAKPAMIPFPPHEEHVRRLEEWLLQHFSASAFNTTRSPLPVMDGEPHHIHLAPNAVPYACHTPASVPKHWEDELRPLSPGTRVRMQNQASGTWDRTGLIVEALPYRQYTVRLDGSGRISLRNRKHLRPVAESTPPPAPPTLRPPTPPAAQPTTTPAQVSTPTQPQLRPAPRRQVTEVDFEQETDAVIESPQEETLQNAFQPRRSSANKRDDELKEAFHLMKSLVGHVTTRDEYHVFGENVAHKLRDCGKSVRYP